MIIFGWRTFVSKIGVVFKRMCNHCHNEEYWVLNRITKWFTLFFIPVIPLENKYFLSCPICQYGLNLDSNQVKTLKPIAEINQLLMDGKIDQSEYQNKINLLDSTTNFEKVDAQGTSSVVINSTDLKYCANCGSSVTKEIKFCANCGTNVKA
jgi:hypothetical protein